ncbi:MAG TPA: hypothetical protein VM582_07205 [Candidatus Thermoplasmatota archaeon]|nr:hypothetical protein [Candidatus Thermoplasmatota archaeon]
MRRWVVVGLVALLLSPLAAGSHPNRQWYGAGVGGMNNCPATFSIDVWRGSTSSVWEVWLLAAAGRGENAFDLNFVRCLPREFLWRDVPGGESTGWEQRIHDASGCWISLIKISRLDGQRTATADFEFQTRPGCHTNVWTFGRGTLTMVADPV